MTVLRAAAAQQVLTRLNLARLLHATPLESPSLTLGSGQRLFIGTMCSVSRQAHNYITSVDDIDATLP